ncbi:hydrolase [Streptomyces sp. 150FB]|uniref:alpha/beta fold hydrolase n=1 Tax=Streptomyces sp. 150FB TaxID=1576605 RepID=UPI0005893EA0|nr:alpha/beta hydrolase [Streptomyces sp. 150FB]KIF76566.1 hydrolase [Streptomyces sp. 150FB]
MSRPSSFTPPSWVQARTLTTSRGPFAVLDARPAGEVRGTVLLLPGYTGSKDEFVPLFGAMAEAGYRAVAVDGRGQFETEGPDTEEAYAQSALAADVLAQTEALGAPVHLLGHSMGGQVARAAVLLDPRPFSTLTLMSSGPAECNADQQERVKLLESALMTMSMEQVWNAIRVLEPLTETEEDGAFLRERWLRNNPLQLVVTGRQLGVEPDRVDELAAVEPMPKHVLSGDSDDKWPVSQFDSMAERLGARRTVIRGAAHSPNRDRPVETAEALTDFWDGHHRNGA